MNQNWPRHFSPPAVRTNLGSGGLSSYSIALEGWRRGLEVSFRSDSLQNYSISDGSRRVDFEFSLPVSVTEDGTRRLLDRKHETLEALASGGVRVPRGVLIDSGDDAIQEIKRCSDDIGYPVVLKPNIGSTGKGVFSNIANESDLIACYEELTRTIQPRRIRLEENIQGHDFRVLVVGHQVAGVILRIPAHVVGDGRSTVRELIDAKNDVRRRNPFLASGLIRVDFEAERLLYEQALRESSVPEFGQHIVLRTIANASAGGDSQDVTAEFPEVIKNAAISALKPFPDLIIAGVDVLYDPSKPAIPENFAVIEINPRPHIGLNMYPSIGAGQDVPRSMIDLMFPGRPSVVDCGTGTLRFNEYSVKNVLRSGSVSSVVLEPAAPSQHLYRIVARYSRLQYAGSDRSVPIRTLQRYASEMRVSGALDLASDGSARLFAAAASESVGRRFIGRVSGVFGQNPSSEHRWRGDVTKGFRVSGPN